MTTAQLAADRDHILHGARPGARRGAAGIVTGILSSFSTVALLATSAYLIARAAEQPPVLFLSMAVVGVRAFALGRAFFRYLERLTTHGAVLRQLEEVRVDLVRRLMPLAPTLGRMRRGTALEAIVSDTGELQNLPLRVVQPLATSLGVALVALVGVWLVLPGAALGLLVCLVVAAATAVLLARRVSAFADRALSPLRASLSNAVLDYVDSFDLLVAYDAEAVYRRRVLDADAALTTASRRTAAGASIATWVFVAFGGVAVAFALICGVPGLAAGELSGPGLAVVVLVPLAVLEVASAVPAALTAWRTVHASAMTLAAVAPARPPAELTVESPGQEDRLEPVDEAPALELRGLTASWPGAGAPALRGIDLRVERGERVVIEGASGSGKTTLAAVLVRFLAYDGGYRLRGREVSGLTPDVVRSVVGLCEQTPYLFDDSVRQNLLFAAPDASDEELHRVLERVGLGDWVRERGGLDARVGERGSLVSGGEAQRIALARALLHDFEVVVFDEPTAGVELDLAGRLVEDLLEASADRTVVLISHGEVPDRLIDRRIRMTDGIATELPVRTP